MFIQLHLQYLQVVLFSACTLTAPLLAQNAFGPATGQFGAGLVSSIADTSSPISNITEGTTPPKIIIDKVVSYPLAGEPDMIVLRNIGGKVANLSGWIITDNKNSGQLADQYVFGKPGCEGNATINPMETFVLTPMTEDNPCGFEFGISFRDQVNLYNDDHQLVASVEWSSSEQGTALARISDGNYVTLHQHNTTVLDILEEAGIFTMFLEALQVTGLADALKNPISPNYDGPHLPVLSPPPAIEIVFPWWFGFQVDRSSLPPPPPPPPSPPPPPLGMPQMGPYTLLAPTDDAFTDLLTVLGGPKSKLPKDLLFELPELHDILQYHIIYGDFTTDYLFNNTGLQTAKGPEVVISKDASQTEGIIAFNDACVDKQTPDEFTCIQQQEFNKCFDPFMVSPMAANWQGGYCQKTCQRCTCNKSSNIKCSMLSVPDLRAGNGVVHGIDRVLFPPPVFSKDQEIIPKPIFETPLISNNQFQNMGNLETTPQIAGGMILPDLPSIPKLPSLSRESLGLTTINPIRK